MLPGRLVGVIGDAEEGVTANREFYERNWGSKKETPAERRARIKAKEVAASRLRCPGCGGVISAVGEYTCPSCGALLAGG